MNFKTWGTLREPDPADERQRGATSGGDGVMLRPPPSRTGLRSLRKIPAGKRMLSIGSNYDVQSVSLDIYELTRVAHVSANTIKRRTNICNRPFAFWASLVFCLGRMDGGCRLGARSRGTGIPTLHIRPACEPPSERGDGSVIAKGGHMNMIRI